MDNVQLARIAYSNPTSPSPQNPSGEQGYFGMLAEDVTLRFAVPPGTPLSEPITGRTAVIEFWTATCPELLTDSVLTESLQFLPGNQKVVALGREDYIVKKSGFVAKGKAIAMVLTFDKGLIVEDLQVREMTEFIDAMRSA